jgi:hypothetical protein
MQADVVIARLARERHAVFTREAAIAAGVTARQLRWRAQRGVLEVMEPGVYRLAGSPPTWKQRVLAAALAEDGHASHRTAAALWGLEGFGPGIVEVVTRRWRRRPNWSFRLHESSALEPEDCDEVDGIPVTSVARTIVDVAAVVPARRVEAALDTPGVDLEAVWACAERLGSRGRPWVAVTGRLVAARLGVDGARPNLFERKLFEVLQRAGLPLPTAQVEIRGGDGCLVGRVDWCYEPSKVVLECDSYRHHGQWVRRKADLRRDRALIALGYCVLRFSWEDVTDLADQSAADVAGALQAVSA